MNEQSWRAEQYADHAPYVSDLGTPVVSLLNPQPGERILDLGCGEGTLANKIQQMGASIVGIDSSPSMVDAARAKGLTAEVTNGERLSFDGEFDAVFSNAALHWMTNPASVIRGVHQALKSQGRFVGEFGGHGNIHCLIEGMRAAYADHPELGTFTIPWYFPTAREYSKALETNGFRVNSIRLIPRPTPLKTGVREWLKLFADYAIRTMSQSQAENFLDTVEDKLRPQLFSEEAGWVADYVRLRFSASKA